MKKFINEFKTFISRGNVLDLAVGVIIGGAFNTIVNSLVNDIFMPIIGIIIGGINFSGLVLKIGEATIKYGLFIQNIINFLATAFCLFLLIINAINSSLSWEYLLTFLNISAMSISNSFI